MGLVINRRIELPEDELEFEAARSGGPGGQNVNKVASKVILRFRPAQSRALGPEEKARIAERLAHRLTRSGELVLHASTHRQRSRNLEAARARLADLLAEALRAPKPRKETRPTRASGRRRLEAKRRKGAAKRNRRAAHDSD
jgi:ribosome-associated protein